MRFPKNITSRMGNNKKRKVIGGTFCLLLCFLILINMMYLTSNFNQSSKNILYVGNNVSENDLESLNTAAGVSIFQDPFTINFTKIWSFFEGKYKTDLDLAINTYYRLGNSIGTILSHDIYPIDNLMLYRTILKADTSAYDTFNNYLILKDSPLWYQDPINAESYGFIHSYNESTGLPSDSNRYLIDNLNALFLLIENIGPQINSINIGGKTPKNEIETIFNLIDSVEYWDETYGGFSHYNTTDFTENKFSESNFYAIMALLEVRHIYEQLNLAPIIKNRAYLLANETMDVLLTNMWDDVDKGFYYNAFYDWNTTGLSGGTYKYLHVNALGIITLLKYYLETGMTNTSLLDKAITTYQKIDQNLWNPTYGAYQYSKNSIWGTSGQDLKIDLEANALMMLACLNLFEVTSNITYYDKALTLHDSFERSDRFYDASVNAYRSSIYSPDDNDKNLYANLRLIDAYLKGYDIYKSTIITANFNVTDNIPDFIVDQDTLNLISQYHLKKENQFYNESSNEYETLYTEYNITSADITYIFKYSNGSVFYIEENTISSNQSTLLYDISESLPIGNSYSLYIFANTSNFGTATNVKQFNVISGLINHSIMGLPPIIYQGPTYNITLPVNNTRNANITLQVTMEGESILNQSKIIEFGTSILTNISFNLKAKLDASIGSQDLIFKFVKDGKIYLEVIQSIVVGYSFDFKEFIYQGRIIPGDLVSVSFNLVNYLPNTTQSVNISFTGEFITEQHDEVFLLKNEIKTLYYELHVIEGITNEQITIKMTQSKGNTTYYSKNFNVIIVPKFEIRSVSFPSIVPQGSIAYFILNIQNNQEQSETFSLYINNEKVTTNLLGLAPGENRIIAEVIPTINPYDFTPKYYVIELMDSTGQTIAKYYYEVTIELSPANLVIFYLIPLLIPVGIVLFYKNKELKHKLLRR